nr:arylsulfatase [Pseudomonas schmalbachii]
MKLGKLAAALCTLYMASCSALADDRPNLLIIVADDMGYSDIGSFGGEIETPNLDALARNGVRLTGFHTAPTCSPARSMLLTGTDNHQAGLGNMAELLQPEQKGKPGYEGYLNQRTANIAEVLKAAGYHTYTTGKWHLGRADDQTPGARGFERSYVLLQGAASHYDDQIPDRNVDPKALYRDDGKLVDVPKGFFSTEFYTDKLIEYLDADRQDGKPFFAYLAYTAPHWPLQAPDEWIRKYEGRYAGGYEKVRQQRLARMEKLGIIAPGTRPNTPMRNALPGWSELTEQQRMEQARSMEVYAAMIDNMDHHIGRLLDHLKSTGKLDNTVILFMSDNGADGNSPLDLPGSRQWIESTFDNSLQNMGRKGSFIDYGAQWAQVSATPWLYYKGFTSQGGIVAPAILNIPSMQGQGSINREVFSVMDVMPTFLELAHVQHPGTRFQGREVYPMQGRSMLPALAGQAQPERVIGWELLGRRAVRKGDWKMISLKPPYGTGRWQLYDIARDPTEARDISAENPQKVAELASDWDTYAARNQVLTTPVNIKYGFQTCLYGKCFR